MWDWIATFLRKNFKISILKFFLKNSRRRKSKISVTNLRSKFVKNSRRRNELDRDVIPDNFLFLQKKKIVFHSSRRRKSLIFVTNLLRKFVSASFCVAVQKSKFLQNLQQVFPKTCLCEERNEVKWHMQSISVRLCEENLKILKNFVF